MLSTAIFVYAATSPINGYAGGGLYARMGGRIWIKQMLLSAFLLPVLVCGTAFFINFIAMYYHASRAIPFGSMVNSMWIFRYIIFYYIYTVIYNLVIFNDYFFFLGRGNLYLHIRYPSVDTRWYDTGT